MKRLWIADPHRFGPGKTHQIDDEDDQKTLCGRMLSDVAGKESTAGDVTCMACAATPARRQRNKEQAAAWQAQQKAREHQRAQEKLRWRRMYHDHLQSAKWAAIRDKVMRRAHFRCEGCGDRRATQVHHMSYDHVPDEFLWELRAVCDYCHDKLHPGRGLNLATATIY